MLQPPFKHVSRSSNLFLPEDLTEHDELRYSVAIFDTDGSTSPRLSHVHVEHYQVNEYYQAFDMDTTVAEERQ